MSDIVTQYAQDLLIECGWSLADLDDKLAKNTLRLMADSCGRPGDYLSRIKTSFRVAREAARLAELHQGEKAKDAHGASIRARYAELIHKAFVASDAQNKW